MSPVHPIRSSRCGQSVGIDRKLPFMPHTTFSWNRLSSSEDDSNQPVRRMSEPITSAVTDAGSNVPGQPSIDAYRNPWNCLLYTSDAADEEDSVDLGGR